ncbi:MAG: PKD domain-containing protein [Candidatus Promineifilaceae bacterium]
MFNGHKVIVVNNHFNSSGGDTPRFGRVQPPEFPSEVQRSLIAQVVNDFVDSIVALDPAARVIVAGDLNDFQFSDAVGILSADVLNNMIDTLPIGEQYTYIYDGNSQVLDHILLSDSLFNDALPEVDVVHVNAEFDTDFRKSDHDPVVSRVTLFQLTVGFTSNPPVIMGASAIFSNTSTGAAPITYEWDFGDGSAVVTDTNPTHLYAPEGTYTVVLTATNLGGTDVYTDAFEVQVPTDVVLSGFSAENRADHWLRIFGLFLIASLSGFFLFQIKLLRKRV